LSGARSDDGSDDVEEVVAAAVAGLDDPDAEPLWALADEIARLRTADPAQLDLVRELLAGLGRPAGRRAARRGPPGFRPGAAPPSRPPRCRLGRTRSRRVTGPTSPERSRSMRSIGPGPSEPAMAPA